jgi:hypothetical protein
MRPMGFTRGAGEAEAHAEPGAIPEFVKINLGTAFPCATDVDERYGSKCD